MTGKLDALNMLSLFEWAPVLFPPPNMDNIPAMSGDLTGGAEAESLLDGLILRPADELKSRRLRWGAPVLLRVAFVTVDMTAVAFFVVAAAGDGVVFS
jgi:hypothetical protein